MSNIQYQLKGKRALVTGGASGIGLATATLLARGGARVVINDLATSVHLDAALASLRSEGADVHAVTGSVGDAETAADIVAQSIAHLGGLDYLINNAGTPATPAPIPPSDLDALTGDFWQTILSVNLLGPFWMTKAAAPALKASCGSVVNTASISAFGGGASSTAYAAAKAGLVGLTRELARGLAPEVRVNAIAPGIVNSNWQCNFGDTEGRAKQVVPLQRVGQPEDYAEVIAFLAVGATYMTGETLTVSGGMRI